RFLLAVPALLLNRMALPRGLRSWSDSNAPRGGTRWTINSPSHPRLLRRPHPSQPGSHLSRHGRSNLPHRSFSAGHRAALCGMAPLTAGLPHTIAALQASRAGTLAGNSSVPPDSVYPDNAQSGLIVE